MSVNRDIVITPDRGASTDPTIRFTGADSLSSATIVLRVYNSGTDATLSFEGDVGQLFSITDSTFGPIFSVNDITGIPSIEVLDTGEIRMAQYSGFVSVLGTTNATNTATGVLRVAGGVGIGRDTFIGGNLTVFGNVTAGSGTVFGTISTATTVAITNDTASATANYLTFVSGTSGNLPIKVDSNALSFVPSTNALGIGTANPYSRLSIVSSANTEGISLFTSAYEAGRTYGTRIWKNDISGGIPLQIDTQDNATWYNSIRISHGQTTTHPSLTTFFETHLATTGGNVGIGITAPLTRAHIHATGLNISGGNAIRGSTMAGLTISNTNNDNSSVGIWFGTNQAHWTGISGQRTDSASTWGTHLSFYTHEDNTVDLTHTRERMRISSAGNVGINTTDFSYTTSDNSRFVGANTNNRLFVNGSIQLLGNNDAIVIGRGTATFLTDEELGFGWGGGWWMNESNLLRVRNNKTVYNEGFYSGARFQNFGSSYDAPNLFMVRADDTNWAFGSSSNNSNVYWMQVKYSGVNDNNRGFRVLDTSSGVARMSVADRITTHQNTFYRTFQSYTGSDNNPVKTWDGVLCAGSDNVGAQALTIIDTTVPQDSYMMGGFTIEWFESYISTNAKTTIKLAGYWNAQSNGGFQGWEYTTSNPSIVPTIRVARNSATGNTSIILTHFNSNYAVILARDLWLGYSGGDYTYGHGWTIKQQADTTGYTNIVSVVARAAAAASGLNADTLDGLDSSQFLRDDVSTTWAASNGPLFVTTPAGASGANTGQVNTLQVYQANVNTDAFMSFHVAGDYAAHFGLDGSTNDLFYGGWSVGGVKHRVYHAGNTDLNLVRDAVSMYKWNVSADGLQARRWNILRLWGTPNHWGAWQNIRIRIDSTYFTSGFVEYHLYGFYGQGNGNSWTLLLKDAGGVETNRFRVSLGPVTLAGFTSGGQNTYYQDVFVDVDYYMSVNVTALFYGNSYQTATPGAESYTLTQLFTSPSVSNITYTNDDKSSSYLFTSKIWNAGNDGAGSGLDADLLDGLNGSDYWTKSGSWWGSGFNGSRLQGVSANGGEFVLIQDHPNVSQVSVLIDGEYYAGENNGFFMVPANTYGSRRGMRWNGSQIDFTTNNPEVLVSSLVLPQNPVGVGYGSVSTQPPYSISQQRGDNDAWRIYGESPSGTNTGALILQSEDDFDSNESIRLRFKRTYGSFNTSDVLIANFDRVTTVSHRSDIYYDSNDTGYYLDPNSTSDAALRIRGGALHGPNPTWGSFLLVGGDGRQNYTNSGSVASVCSTNGNLHLDSASGYETYINYYDGSNVYFGNGSNGIVAQVASDGTFRSPIYYDYNNTGFYLDPNGTSILNTVFAEGQEVLTTNLATASGGQFWNLEGDNYVQAIYGNMDPLNNSNVYNAALFRGGGWTLYGFNGSSWVNLGTVPGLTNGYGKANWGSGFSMNSTYSQYIVDCGASFGYSFLSALTLTHSTNGNSFDFYFERSTSSTYNAGTWEVMAQALGQNSWPGGTSVKFNSVVGAWAPNFVRIRFVPNWSNPTWRPNGINIGHFSVSAAYGGANQLLNWDTNYNVTADGSFRSPIFYDSNDTNWYIDPNADLSIRVFGEISNSNYQQGAMQPGALNIGRTDRDYGWDGTSWASDIRAGIMANCSELFEFVIHDSGDSVESVFRYDGGNQLLMGRNIGWGTMYIEAAQDFRAPIFYDSNNTGYYVDPNGTSRIGGIQISPADTGATGNGIRFYGLAGDNAGGYNHAAIIERLWGTVDQSELLIFKGNDPDVSTIHDRIRIAATGRIVFHSYNGYADVDTYITAAGGGNINGSGFFNGNELYITGDVTAYFSDRRLKTDIKQIENPLEKVKSLNGIIYKHNDLAKTFGFTSENSIVGLFADEVEAVLPEAVKLAPFDDNDGESLTGENYKTVQYEKLIPLLVEAVKELTTKVESYEAKIAYLENKINKDNS